MHRNFGTGIVPGDLEGTQEDSDHPQDGRYDNDNKKGGILRSDLGGYGNVRRHRNELDELIKPIEVIQAILKLRMGSASGVDGMIVNFLNNRKVPAHGENTVVGALVESCPPILCS
jgi:hypothetical protein